MRFKVTSTIALISFGFLSSAVAGPHLGMKLACKKYGDAWNSGSRGALYGQITGDFASVFQRMPHEMFAQMPRGGGGQVLSHSKGSGSGRVTVSTSQGVMTFVVVGNGFNWRVADIYKRGDDGRTVSLKSYLDATVVAHEFIRDLKRPSGTQFYASISRDFGSSFRELTPGDLQVVRGTIPDVRVVGKPHLSMNGSWATMNVTLEGNRRARMQLVREGRWKVHDYAVESPDMSIASFRQSLKTIAVVQQFRQFMQEPTQIDPAGFTKEGSLKDSFAILHERGHLPMHQKPSHMKFCSIDATGSNVHIDLLDRKVRVVVDTASPRALIEKVDVTMGNRWADLGHLIALNERVRTTMSFVGLANSRTSALPATAVVELEEAEESVLTNVVATTVEPAAPAPAPAPSPAVAVKSSDVVQASAVAQAPVVRRVSYSTPVVRYAKPTVQYQRVVTQKRGGLFRRFRGR